MENLKELNELMAEFDKLPRTKHGPDFEDKGEEACLSVPMVRGFIQKKFLERKDQEALLLLTLNALTDKWDKIETEDPDQSTQKWMSYKKIRNNIRDTIKEIAESKGIKL